MATILNKRRKFYRGIIFSHRMENNITIYILPVQMSIKITDTLQCYDYITVELWYSAHCFVIYGLALLQTNFRLIPIDASQALLS
jgi:hypothetical protein